MSGLNHIPTYRFAASMLSEIKDLVHNIRTPQTTKLIFQSLPKHMRRRAMSHHPKRLPRKYRDAHCAQMSKSGHPKSVKRPSRKYRRRPNNLLSAYERRQREHKWLETHIWHARRFHMIDRWGFRLAYASCDKTYRACYRASTNYCLVQDISYMMCLEIQGYFDELGEGFKRLTSEFNKITGKRFKAGRFEGTLHLFKDGGYPRNAICKCNFMWKPIDEDALVNENTTERTLWLWLHPLAYSAVLNELTRVFNLSREQIKASGESQKPSSVYLNPRKSVKLYELKDSLLRFRLTGTQSHAVLTNAFNVYKSTDETKLNHDNWFQSMCNVNVKNAFQTAHEHQSSIWQNITQLPSSTMLPSNCIIGLNIYDPRLSRPSKRTKAQSSSADVCANLQKTFDISANLYETINKENWSYSAMWQSKVRKRVKSDMLSTHQCNELRAKHAAINGALCSFEIGLHPVPVLLVQRPGAYCSQSQRLGYGAGWDIIAPAGYGMAIWLTFIMWGAKAGGLRESESISRELGSEQHLPDTLVAKKLADENYIRKFALYFRRPPNRRHNYRKLAIISPFKIPFSELVQDWMQTKTMKVVSTPSSFYVLREPHILIALSCWFSKSFTYSSECSDLLGDHENALLPITVRTIGRGRIEDNAIICIPQKRDLQKLFKYKLKSMRCTALHVEPKCIDTNEKQRKDLVLQHKKLLIRLRRPRVNEKRRLQRTSLRKVRIRAANTAPIVSEHFRKMCKLWLPDDYSADLQNVRMQCSRQVIGYVTSGCESLLRGESFGNGFVTIAGLKALLEANKKYKKGASAGIQCLVRNIRSRSYYLAVLKSVETQL